MKLVMTLLVRDEEDLIRSNIEYHLSRGVDQIIATDNLSQDSTREILQEYQESGKLEYIFEESDDYSQGIWVTNMARMAVENFNADWVFHIDADEFWWPGDGRSIKSFLKSVPPEFDGLKASRFNFVPVPWLDKDTDFYKEMIYREVESMNSVGNPLPPKVIHRGMTDVQVTQGNHNFSRDSGDVSIQDTGFIEVLHYPVRTWSSFSSRIRQGGQAYERNRDLSPKVGDTWRKLWKLAKDGGLPAYFDSQLWDEQKIQEGIESGVLVRDVRLMEYMTYLSGTSHAAFKDVEQCRNVLD